jgi:hypothetical protein
MIVIMILISSCLLNPTPSPQNEILRTSMRYKETFSKCLYIVEDKLRKKERNERTEEIF